MNRARPMAARLKKNKSRVNLEPRSAHGRAVNKSRLNLEPRSAHGRAVNNFSCINITDCVIQSWPRGGLRLVTQKRQKKISRR